jgi:hypothetical protein
LFARQNTTKSSAAMAGLVESTANITDPPAALPLES